MHLSPSGGPSQSASQQNGYHDSHDLRGSRATFSPVHSSVYRIQTHPLARPMHFDRATFHDQSHDARYEQHQQVTAYDHGRLPEDMDTSSPSQQQHLEEPYTPHSSDYPHRSRDVQLSRPPPKDHSGTSRNGNPSTSTHHTHLPHPSEVRSFVQAESVVSSRSSSGYYPGARHHALDPTLDSDHRDFGHRGRNPLLGPSRQSPYSLDEGAHHTLHRQSYDHCRTSSSSYHRGSPMQAPDMGHNHATNPASIRHASLDRTFPADSAGSSSVLFAGPIPNKGATPLTQEKESKLQNSRTEMLSDCVQHDPGSAGMPLRDRAFEDRDPHLRSIQREREREREREQERGSPGLDEPVHPPPHRRPAPSSSRYWEPHPAGLIPLYPSDDRSDHPVHYGDRGRWHQEVASQQATPDTPHTLPLQHASHHRLQAAHGASEPDGSSARPVSPSTISSHSTYTPRQTHHMTPPRARLLPPPSQHSDKLHAQLQPQQHLSQHSQQDQTRTAHGHSDRSFERMKQDSDDDHEDNAQEDSDNDTQNELQNLGFKFGTVMPTTVDLKAAIDSCDILCKFALHYAHQSQESAGEEKDEPFSGLETLSNNEPPLAPVRLAEHERATLKAIQRMSSAMLIGLRNVPKESGGDFKDSLNCMSMENSLTEPGDSVHE
ncbi:hypothetical protein BG004_004278, partial [Podila humilis]